MLEWLWIAANVAGKFMQDERIRDDADITLDIIVSNTFGNVNLDVFASATRLGGERSV